MARPYERLIHEHHWVYYTLMKPWTALAGTSEVALRLPSVAAAAAACAVLVPLGNRLMGRPVGAIAGLVLALDAFAVQWSQQARSYSFVLLASLGVTAALVHLRGARTRRAWVVYAASLGGLVLLQPLSAGLLFGAHLVAARGARVRVATAGATIALLTSPFLAGVYGRDSRSGTLVWNASPTTDSVTRTILELSGALGVGLLLALVALATVRRERLLLASWALVPFAVSLALAPLAPLFIDRYLIVSAPAFALLVAAAIARLRGPWRVGAIGAFAVGAVGGLLIWYAPDGSQNWAGQDWKAATALAMRGGGARVAPSWATPAYTYYGGVPAPGGALVLALGAPRGRGVGSPRVVEFGNDLRLERLEPAGTAGRAHP